MPVAENYLDMPCLGWGDLLSTGVDERQLRSAMNRDLIALGVKRNNRLFYTLRERFIADAIALMDVAWVPISTSATIAALMSKDLEKLLATYTVAEGKIGWLRLNFAKGENAIGLSYDDDLDLLQTDTQIPKSNRTAILPVFVSLSVDALLYRLIDFCREIQIGAGDDGREGEK